MIEIWVGWKEVKELQDQIKKYLPGKTKREIVEKLGPKTFYYQDQVQIRELYLQVNQDLDPIEIETQESATKDKGIKAEIKGVGSDYKKSDQTQTIKKYHVDTTTTKMYNEVEKYFFDRLDTNFDLEDFMIKSEIITEIRSIFSDIETKLEVEIPQELEEKIITKHKNLRATTKIERISGASGYIFIRCELTVNKVSESECWLDYDHPLNMVLTEDQVKIHFKIPCSIESLTPSGKTIFKEGESVKINCFGKIVRWNEKSGELLINPIAIY